MAKPDVITVLGQLLAEAAPESLPTELRAAMLEVYQQNGVAAPGGDGGHAGSVATSRDPVVAAATPAGPCGTPPKPSPALAALGAGFIGGRLRSADGQAVPKTPRRDRHPARIDEDLEDDIMGTTPALPPASVDLTASEAEDTPAPAVRNLAEAGVPVAALPADEGGATGEAATAGGPAAAAAAVAAEGMVPEGDKGPDHGLTYNTSADSHHIVNPLAATGSTVDVPPASEAAEAGTLPPGPATPAQKKGWLGRVKKP
jgi:hypothetical protein